MGCKLTLAILLLQGPLGPFFNHLSSALTSQGQVVHKINFNGGDRFFYSQKNSVNFTGSVDQWPAFLIDYIEKHSVCCVLTYGDCRFYHHEAKRICINSKIQYFAFEEGYLRPNYITFEMGGVNGHSPITHEAVDSYDPIHEVLNEKIIPGNFIRRICYAALYYNIAFLKGLKFPKYVHHRSFNPVYEALCWGRSSYRKVFYRLIQKNAKKLCKEGEFFLVPLQVHNDAQIEFHSQYESMQDFIVDVLGSFAQSGSNKRLIFKHHPMDRGHVNYAKLIQKKAAEFKISNQVSYIHDQHLPTLLRSCEGVVTINSTTALQAFYHGAPVVVTGYAFFDMPGLTHQGSLASFWKTPTPSEIELPDKLRAYILNHGQINGSFYTASDITLANLVSYLHKAGLLSSKLPLSAKN